MLTRDGLNKEVFEKRRGVPTMRGGLLSAFGNLRCIYLFVESNGFFLQLVTLMTSSPQKPPSFSYSLVHIIKQHMCLWLRSVMIQN